MTSKDPRTLDVVAASVANKLDQLVREQGLKGMAFSLAPIIDDLEEKHQTIHNYLLDIESMLTEVIEGTLTDITDQPL